MYLWRAVDHEREVLDILVQRRRDTRAALSLMRKLLERDVEPSVKTKVMEGWIAPLLAEQLVTSWRNRSSVRGPLTQQSVSGRCAARSGSTFR